MVIGGMFHDYDEREVEGYFGAIGKRSHECHACCEHAFFTRECILKVGKKVPGRATRGRTPSAIAQATGAVRLP